MSYTDNSETEIEFTGAIDRIAWERNARTKPLYEGDLMPTFYDVGIFIGKTKVRLFLTEEERFDVARQLKDLTAWLDDPILDGETRTKRGIA